MDGIEFVKRLRGLPNPRLAHPDHLDDGRHEQGDPDRGAPTGYQGLLDQAADIRCAEAKIKAAVN
jgi:hypothetical protein